MTSIDSLSCKSHYVFWELYQLSQKPVPPLRKTGLTFGNSGGISNTWCNSSNNNFCWGLILGKRFSKNGCFLNLLELRKVQFHGFSGCASMYSIVTFGFSLNP